MKTYDKIGRYSGEFPVTEKAEKALNEYKKKLKQVLHEMGM